MKLLGLLSLFLPSLMGFTTTQLQLTVIFWKLPTPPRDEENLTHTPQLHIVKNRNSWLEGCCGLLVLGTWPAFRDRKWTPEGMLRSLRGAGRQCWRVLSGEVFWGVWLLHQAVSTQPSLAKGLLPLSIFGKRTQLH